MPTTRSTTNHPVGEVRHGQLITTYGPGSMVDLPDRSVVIGGLNLWHHNRDDDSALIDEPRLIAKLRGLLEVGTLLPKSPPLKKETSPKIQEQQWNQLTWSFRFGSLLSRSLPSPPSSMDQVSGTAPDR